jgi:hypothetical protein
MAQVAARSNLRIKLQRKQCQGRAARGTCLKYKTNFSNQLLIELELLQVLVNCPLEFNDYALGYLEIFCINQLPGKGPYSICCTSRHGGWMRQIFPRFTAEALTVHG